jgi:hypothetical protein
VPGILPGDPAIAAEKDEDIEVTFGMAVAARFGGLRVP